MRRGATGTARAPRPRSPRSARRASPPQATRPAAGQRQRVAAAGDDERGCCDARRIAAQVGRRQHGKRVRERADATARRARTTARAAPRASRGRRSLPCTCSVRKRCSVSFYATCSSSPNRASVASRHRVRPVRPGDEPRRRADEHEPRHARRMRQRPVQRDQCRRATSRAPRAVAFRASSAASTAVDHGVERARRDRCAVAVSRQVDRMDAMARASARRRAPRCRRASPSRAAARAAARAGRLDRQPVHACALGNAARAASDATSSSVCAADSDTRSRAVPCGTVGGRIAGTQKPRSRKARGDVHRRAAVADDQRLDRGRRRQQRATAGARAPSRNCAIERIKPRAARARRRE